MSELKTNIHLIVDRIESEQLLHTLFDFLKNKEASRPGEIWSALTEEQKQEVLSAYEESEDEKNLTDGDEVFRKLR